MRQKVLYFITKSNSGGAQRYVFDLATSLPKANFEALVAAGGAPESPLLRRLSEAGVRVIPIISLQRDVSVWADTKSFFEMFRICRMERPQVVHVNSSKAGGLGALCARLAGVPRIVFTCHGWAFNEERPWLSRTAIRFLSWLTVMLSHITIAVSNRDFIDGKKMPFCASKMFLVHNGIAEPQFKNRDLARASLAAVGKLSGIEFPRDSLLFGAIGELHKNKGYEYMIRAFAIARKSRNFPYRLIIMGTGEEKENLKKLISSLDLETDIALLGHVENAASFLPAFDAFTLTSIKEGLPYTVIEAGFAGLPVVATNVGGVKEMIEDMKTGILVQTRKPDDIAQGLLLLAKDPERALTYGAALREKVRAEFSLEQMIEKTVKVYVSI
ncbi:MAG TPA: glycosyltransferase family 4 protein [Candidatus Paceibacterota bacterium]|jgi:Glycosyltransferase